MIFSNHDEVQNARIERAKRNSGIHPTVRTNASGNPTRTEEEKKANKYRALTGRVVIDPIEMEYTYKVREVTSTQLCGAINSIFRNTFPQWDGSRVTIDQYGVHIAFYFTNKPNISYSDEHIEVLKFTQAVDPSDRTSGGLAKAINDRGKYSNVYEMTQEGKDALSEFIYINPHTIVGDRRDNNFAWEKFTMEETEKSGNFYFPNDKIVFKVEIDPARLLAKMYGAKNKVTGSEYIYSISPVRHISGYDYLLEIKQLDKNLADEVISKSTGYIINNNLGICRN